MSTFRRRFIMPGAKTEESIKPYMHIEALEDGLTISLSRNSIEYSLDGSTWMTLPANTASPAINTGEKIYFKGELTPSTSYGIGTFTLSKKCNAGGNAMSLLFGDDFQNQYSLSGKDGAFMSLFESCDTLISVSDNFLPATVLSSRCYDSTFDSCDNLIKAPTLPALTLVTNCYRYMFSYCSSLNYIKALFTSIPGSGVTYNWVAYTASSGTFVKNKSATWSVTGRNGIPSGWTVITE